MLNILENGRLSVDLSHLMLTLLHQGVGIAMGYRLDDLGLIPIGARFFSSPQHPDSLWGPPNLLSIEHEGHFAWE
jgi:hypothetical protein